MSDFQISHSNSIRNHAHRISKTEEELKKRISQYDNSVIIDIESQNIEQDPYYTEHKEQENLLIENISKSEKLIKTLNSESYINKIKSSFFKTQYNCLNDQKHVLKDIFSRIKIILNDRSLSFDAKSRNLEKIHAEINRYSKRIEIEKHKDQGKLEDVLVALTSTSTNLWKALIDSGALNTVTFSNASVPFLISILPFSLRTIEYIRIQMHEIKFGDLSKLLAIYEELSTDLKDLIEKLQLESLHTTQNSAQEYAIENKPSKGKDKAYSSEQIIEAMQGDLALKEAVLNEFFYLNPNHRTSQYGYPYAESSRTASSHTIVDGQFHLQVDCA